MNYKYRMYVDEVGNSDLQSSNDPNHRYLSLTGIIIELNYVDKVVFPALDNLKRKYFGGHVDEPIILHRKELLNATPPFDCLRDETTRAEFNCELINIIENLDYVIVTVVIDKKAHSDQYQVWHYDPYHYCMMILVERYVRFLEDINMTGDVLSESRGGKDDMRLKKSFEQLCENGTEYINEERINLALTSRQLKVKPKANNIAGLQLADLLAHPSFISTKARENHEALPENFGGVIAEILESHKYYRNLSGKIAGYGRKWLP